MQPAGNPRQRAISAEVARFEDEHGVELTPEEFNHIGVQVDLYGVTPEQAYGSTDSGRFEADFGATVEAVEREQGRKLLDGEIDAMWEAAESAADDPAVETDAGVFAKAREAAPNMLDTSDGIAEYIGQRLSVPPVARRALRDRGGRRRRRATRLQPR